MPWFDYNQNNSGGRFHFNDKAGIGPRVWIEAKNGRDADRRAEDIGIYFNGCDSGRDCSCCGDRWYSQEYNKGDDQPLLSPEYDFQDQSHRPSAPEIPTVYLHDISGTIHRVTKDMCTDEQLNLPRPSLVQIPSDIGVKFYG